MIVFISSNLKLPFWMWVILNFLPQPFKSAVFSLFLSSLCQSIWCHSILHCSYIELSSKHVQGTQPLQRLPMIFQKLLKHRSPTPSRLFFLPFLKRINNVFYPTRNIKTNQIMESRFSWLCHIRKWILKITNSPPAGNQTCCRGCRAAQGHRED